MEIIECVEHTKPYDSTFDALVSYVLCSFGESNIIYHWLKKNIDDKMYTMERDSYDEYGYTENDVFKIVIYDFTQAVEFKLRWC